MNPRGTSNHIGVGGFPAALAFKGGGRRLYSVAAHESFEACDLLSTAEHDESIPGMEPVVRRGRRVELTISGPDREDYAPVLSPTRNSPMVRSAMETS